MTFVTRGIFLSRGTDIATCHNRDLIVPTKKKFAKKKTKKLKKLESDT